jgi:lipopolysaccharide export system permease protein
MPSSSYSPLPVLSRYLVRQFLALFLPITLAFVLLYIVIDLFDRLDILLRHQASVGASARYFLFKIPLMLTQIMPPAVVVSTLLSLGLLSRRNEVIALRAGGVSLNQTAVPIMAAALGISFLALGWNETVVPYSSRKFQYVNNVEIRKRTLRGILSDREIWYHGSLGFYNIDHVDRAREAVYGLTIYRLDDDFDLKSVVQIPKATWRKDHWIAERAYEHRIGGETLAARPISFEELAMSETLADFLEVQREPEELSFALLRQRINDLTRKGIDASHFLVDLHLKIALPFANAVLAFVALPIAGKLRRHPSVAGIVGLGTVVGFSYWVLLGLANSLGQTGTLPPMIAAWSANLVFLLVGVALFLYAE